MKNRPLTIPEAVVLDVADSYPPLRAIARADLVKFSKMLIAELGLAEIGPAPAPVRKLQVVR